jgi:hypothetical protein
VTGVQTCALPIFVIRNDGSPEETLRAVDNLWEELQKRERRRREEAC